METHQEKSRLYFCLSQKMAQQLLRVDIQSADVCLQGSALHAANSNSCIQKSAHLLQQVCVNNSNVFCDAQEKRKKSKHPYPNKIQKFQQECLGKMKSPVEFDRLHMLPQNFLQNSFKECSSCTLLSLNQRVVEGGMAK